MEDVAESIKKCKELGGKVIEESKNKKGIFQYALHHSKQISPEIFSVKSPFGSDAPSSTRLPLAPANFPLPLTAIAVALNWSPVNCPSLITNWTDPC